MVLGGAAVSLFQLYTRLPKSRGSLARDIEILNMLDKDDPAYKVIRAHVDSRVEEIYNPSETSSRKIRIYSWFHLVLGLVFLRSCAMDLLPVPAGLAVGHSHRLPGRWGSRQPFHGL